MEISKPKVDEKYVLFARHMRKCGLDVHLNRELLSQKDVPPLVYGDSPAELIIQKEPFFMSQKLYGISPDNAVTINSDLVSKYTQEYDNFTFFYRINWDEQTRAFRGYTISAKAHKGIYRADLKMIRKLVNRGTPMHTRKNKTGDVISYVFDVNDFEKIG